MKFKEMQPFMDVRMWGAISGKYSFLITFNQIGWNASYKDREYLGKQSSHFIGNFNTQTEAEKACKEQLRKLRFN